MKEILISFVIFDENGEHGYGNCVAAVRRFPLSEDEVRELESTISKENNAKNVILMNYMILRKGE